MGRHGYSGGGHQGLKGEHHGPRPVEVHHPFSQEQLLEVVAGGDGYDGEVGAEGEDGEEREEDAERPEEPRVSWRWLEKAIRMSSVVL